MKQKERVTELLGKTEEIFKSGEICRHAAKVLIRRIGGDTGRPFDRWSFHNQILCILQGSEDARGYRQWEQVNRHVKKGAKAIGILAPRLKTAEDEQTKEKKSVLVGFLSIPVFRIEDTEGEPLPDYSPAELPPLADVAAKCGITVYYEAERKHQDAAGWYHPLTNEVRLFTHDHCTFWHELSHAIHYRLKLGQDRTPEERECVAEVSARIIAEAYGMTEQIEQAKSYVFSHSGSDTYRTFVRMTGDIQKVLDEIFGLAESKPEATPVAA